MFEIISMCVIFVCTNNYSEPKEIGYPFVEKHFSIQEKDKWIDAVSLTERDRYWIADKRLWPTYQYNKRFMCHL